MKKSDNRYHEPKIYYSIFDITRINEFYISEAEQNWANDFNKFRKEQYCKARGFSRKFLGKIFNIHPRDIPLYAPPGRPPLLKEGFGYLSISHCKEFIIVAWSDISIGVDIERFDRIISPEQFIQRFYPKEDKYFLRNLNSKEFIYKTIQLWVAREAVIKWHRGNLFRDFNKLLVDKEFKNVFHIENKKSVKIHNYKFKNWIYTIANNHISPPIKISF